MPLIEHDLLAQVAIGEDRSRQFKADIHNAESLAAKMTASSMRYLQKGSAAHPKVICPPSGRQSKKAPLG